jgi:hypothetical protein
MLLEVIGAFTLSFSQQLGRKLADILTSFSQQLGHNFVDKLIQLLPINPNRKLGELDLALLKSLASYFEEMNGKIRHYYRDHHASREEADIIANDYLKTAGIVRSVKTQKDLEKLIKSIETLKKKVSRYQHGSYKYRWSTGLEKEVIVKLNKIVGYPQNLIEKLCGAA